MKLEKIITLANAHVKIQFSAMERSLRATGCNLPIWVIPFNDDKFDLPNNSFWWEENQLIEWAKENNIFEMCRKYQCFFTQNYQYVDSDIIFIRNPEEVLKNYEGFISSCTHWNNPDHTYNAQTKQYFKSKSTIWQNSIFNAGQFACDKALYTLEGLKETSSGTFKETLLDKINIYKDQVAINLLVSLSNVKVTNLTLPPTNMQSTWAGDYVESNFEELYWRDEDHKPYIIHWAGVPKFLKLPVNKYFTKFLNPREYKEWLDYIAKEEQQNKNISLRNFKIKIHRFKKALESV
ncbi:putative nucleotide-diphospho-sugar transferase [Zunongwangia sp. HGR-M22]|uniref:putative nucleotide-diphospho-sugar transferase n=1 Tax=Zunongwangia sp. HGR-M22 TaxID=3015168 RepID=UPI0022DE06A0|nr:putative nucleotide-diphospho-sugar transferase [Zunongwangia sp. HGR-M22]WBL26389.1 putative nucleotide-diphospho-sugar transferase [Zunongwangia sp. HGR-M22]